MTQDQKININAVSDAHHIIEDNESSSSSSGSSFISEENSVGKVSDFIHSDQI